MFFIRDKNAGEVCWPSEDYRRYLVGCRIALFFFFFSSRRRHTRFKCDWSSDVCSSDLYVLQADRSEQIEQADAEQHVAQRTDVGHSRPERLTGNGHVTAGHHDAPVQEDRKSVV